MRRWDIFCKVIDNFGDIGVCWRLARDLAQRGQTVRLWVDDASALSWMAAPDDRPATLTVQPWPDASAAATRDWPEPGDVVIEAFGCDLPGGFVARMQRPAPPVWINLEYLSAEAYVERSHRLPSPVFSGPGAGLKKWFFYPGFTARTGGLLREPGLLQAREAFQQDAAARQDFLAELGVAWQPGERLVNVFCYPGAPVAALLDQLAALPGRTHVLLTPGSAAQQGHAWLTGRTTMAKPAADDACGPGLRVHFPPLLAQPAFDRLLWCADLNFVRGEDSAVRALWAARPHVWQLYPQDDGVHAGKLAAFTDRWMAAWPDALREAVNRLWATWNRLPGSQPESLSLLGELCGPPAETLRSAWCLRSAGSSAELAKLEDLTTQLLHFTDAPG